MIDYEKYCMSLREKVISYLQGAVLGIALFVLFYQNIWISLLGGVIGAICFSYYKRSELNRRRRQELTLQFKDTMEAFVSAMAAGYSMEYAVREARKDLSHMYCEKDYIMQELREMEKRLELRVSIENLLSDLGDRSNVEEIKIFAEVFQTARRSGGNLLRIMRQTTAGISEKIEIQREIQTMIAGKQLEMRCMTIVPLLIIVYLQFSSPGFLEPLYHNLTGQLIMTAALIIYIVSYLLARRIMRIEFS